jgi:hypothetical protein
LEISNLAENEAYEDLMVKLNAQFDREYKREHE